MIFCNFRNAAAQNISAALLECEKSIRKQRKNADKSPGVGAFQDSRLA